MFSYRSILKKAWRVAFKNPYLWFFGLFASFLSIGSEYRILSEPLRPRNIVEWYYRWSALFENGMWGKETWKFLWQNPDRFFLALMVLILVLGLLLFVFWLAVSSQLALIKNSGKMLKTNKEKDDSKIHVSLWSVADKFWPAFFLNILSRVLVFILVLITSLPMLFPMHSSLALNIVYIFCFLIFIPVAICISLIAKYAINFLILKNENFSSAIKKAWRLFVKNWLISLEMGVILFLISFVATILIILASFVLAIPFIILGAAFLQLFSFAAFWFVVTIGIIIVILFIILTGSVLTSFQIISWTDLFGRLVDKKAVSKLHRLSGKK